MEHPENPVYIDYVNHGKLFSDEDWIAFYCGNCGRLIHKESKQCRRCGTILQHKENEK